MKLIYQNPLKNEADIKGFITEGSALITFPEGRMRMQNALDANEGQRANYVLWCPEVFPSDIRVEWTFRPLSGEGLCILFFAASGQNGEDLFSPFFRPVRVSIPSIITEISMPSTFPISAGRSRRNGSSTPVICAKATASSLSPRERILYRISRTAKRITV